MIASFNAFVVVDLVQAVAAAAIAALWLRGYMALRSESGEPEAAGSKPVLALLAFGAACLASLGAVLIAVAETQEGYVGLPTLIFAGAYAGLLALGMGLYLAARPAAQSRTGGSRALQIVLWVGAFAIGICYAGALGG